MATTTQQRTQAPTRYQFLGWIIERGRFGWAVIDWDYEGEFLMHVARTESAAQAWCEQRSF